MTEFNRGPEPIKTRGQEILQALFEGKPEMELASEALNDTGLKNVPDTPQ
ncbi:MAG: hypothetical protein O3A29_15085 [Planctomycetota bacterium]|nr:hypothetical protein [Planctomycetota bacterium]